MRRVSLLLVAVTALLAVPAAAQTPPADGTPTRISGTVAKLDGDTLTVATKDGQTAVVTLTADAAIFGLAKASLEANVRFLAADLGPQGIRVNAISAGPIKTLSAAGIPGLRKMLAHVAATAPIKRNVTIDDVGNAAAFLCSDLAAGISGEVLYVDGGYHTVGMSFPSDGDGA